MTEAKTKFRCAIYARKSTDEGLEQNFNSLDAQRSACEAYILSQAGEGWEYLYDPSGLSYLLRNRIYLGQITHKDKSYPGEHDAIIEADLFQQLQERLAANHHKFVNRQTRSAACPLHNKIFDAQGKPMRPNFGYGRGKKINRYYVSDSLLPLGRLKAGSTTPLGDRLSAERTERFLQDRLGSLVPHGSDFEIFEAIERVMFSSNKLTVTLRVTALIDTNACEDTLLAKAQQIDPAAKIDNDDLGSGLIN